MSRRENLPGWLHWERWPFKIIYAPLTLVWGWYMLRSRAVWFFTPSNPTLTFGGMEGEPKREMYEQLPADLYPTTIYVNPNMAFDEVCRQIEEAGILFPLVAKPDVASAGVFFRRIELIDQLESYHQTIGADYLIQSFAAYPMEMSVFYYRMPGEKQGTITGLLHKVSMQVTGDGKSTLLELIEAHPKASQRIEEIRQQHGKWFHLVLTEGKTYRLSYAGNHNRGATFVNLHDEIDADLHRVFDELSLRVGGWFYGRWDLMVRSLDDLKQGRNFTILEYNGCGAEPNHIYDSGYSLGQAYAEILKHWKALYRISMANRRRGVKPWPLWKGWNFLQEAGRHMEALRQREKQLGF